MEAITNLPSWMLFAVLGGVQLVGLASGWLARASAGSSYQGVCQQFFLVCLGLVGFATLISPDLRPGWWLSCGTTLCVMVLTALCDFGQFRRAGERGA